MKINRRAALLGGLGATLGGLPAATQQDVTFFSASAPVGQSALTIQSEVLSPMRSPIRRVHGPAPTVALVACLTLSARRLPRTVRFPMSPV